MPVRDYQADLLSQLADLDYAALYLKASLNETLKDGDWEAFLLALENVVEARQATLANAADSDDTDKPLQQALGNGETPTLESFVAVLSSVGLAIDVKPA
ncbi:transcriptional regulator [Nodosilinea sp. LEGE 07088]|uniref:helix-turn-helix domain-containing transcriptional regulator n=1 Tax=Nodosilinea sp. LEGE 07088 TaxID=2777968 RepID=UPI001880B173|nr:transcriptional regulator [Nodosilinea sp. LEGE 07088]MBE9140401.1 transcriptional regulator [Nodosilinea sp. LEGE 07088]